MMICRSSFSWIVSDSSLSPAVVRRPPRPICISMAARGIYDHSVSQNSPSAAIGTETHRLALLLDQHLRKLITASFRGVGEGQDALFAFRTGGAGPRLEGPLAGLDSGIYII